jgi:hypothetical protein
MEKVIACCGLNCAACDARIATMADDNELRFQTAEKWKIQYQAAAITPEMINCTGCREAGVKFGHCTQCEIRNCADSKGSRTCAECDMLENCQTIKGLHQYVPEALENLRSLN